MKGYIVITFMFVYVFIVAWLHNKKFIKSNFYIKKIKPKPYSYELAFYLISFLGFVISLIFLSIVLVKLLF
jgi:hypothetical protein